MLKDKYFWLQLFTMIFIASLICANVIAAKILQLGPFVIPAGILVFPLSYICGDVLVEVFGLQRARRVIVLGFLGNALFVVFSMLAQKLPAAPFWTAQSAYDTILGFAPRLLVASAIAYFVGQLSNAQIMHWAKRLTDGRYLWLRTISSTIVGEGLDSLVFISIAFWGSTPPPILLTMIGTQWLLKTLYEAAVTPVTYAIVNYLKNETVWVSEHAVYAAR